MSLCQSKLSLPWVKKLKKKKKYFFSEKEITKSLLSGKKEK
jgi:3-methyladenine DNA glycosylase AlkC